MFYLIGLLALLGAGAYWLFKDTLNRIQYVEFLRLYWIVKDDGGPLSVRADAYMRQTAPPYWRGHGILITTKWRTIQVGVLDYKVDSLDAQLSNNATVRSMLAQVGPKEIRGWRGRAR